MSDKDYKDVASPYHGSPVCAYHGVLIERASHLKEDMEEKVTTLRKEMIQRVETSEERLFNGLSNVQESIRSFRDTAKEDNKEMRDQITTVQKCVRDLKTERLEDRIWVKIGKWGVAIFATCLGLTGVVLAILKYLDYLEKSTKVMGLGG